MKNWKVRTKILTGFIGTLLTLTILSASIIVFFISTSNTLINHITVGQECLLRSSTDIMNMRRMTGMIHAFAGDVGRVEMYNDEFNVSLAATNKCLDEYLDALRDNPLISYQEFQQISTEVAEMKELLIQYKTLLFEPNVINAKLGDVEALMPTSITYGPLIISVSDGITQLLDRGTEVRDTVINNTRSSIDTVILVTALVSASILAIVLFLAFYISGLISKPLVALSAFMKKAGSTGDIMLDPEETAMLQKLSQTNDEIGQTVAATATFIQHVTNIAAELETVASGDLTVHVEQLSKNDVMANALLHMVDSLNSMFGEIINATAQVSEGSHQLEEGAQALALGSTEQTASIEQLSDSIAIISSKTKDNADMANRAATLGITIKSNAEKGNQQMDEMMEAVKEINQASQGISKVIKVIDDIAFQTNILALNAAVEAARAGQHGKGFAVVAEEVRNLAAKSAEAAKETGILISNSSEKAELGTRIAGDTAASLSDIVAGINENSQIVSEIAQSSDEQSVGIEQINIGIEQVAQVIQQNSAAAEQSAAAAEEMSAQANTLQELISQFKLKT